MSKLAKNIITLGGRDGCISPLESDDKLSNMTSRIYDTTHFTVFFADDSSIKSCHPFLLF